MTRFCCCSARTGARVTIIIALILAIIGLIIFAIGTASLHFVVNVTINALQNDELTEDLDDEQAQKIANTLVTVQKMTGPGLRTGLGICISEVVLVVICLVGLLNRKRILLLPWLIVQMIRWVLGVILVNVVGIILLVAKFYVIGGILIGVGSLFITLEFYFWKVVQSEYIHIGEEDESARRQPAGGYVLQPMQKV